MGYLALFFTVVSFYDLYKDSDLLVVLAATVILIGGMAAWIWSVQPGKEK